MSEMLSRCTDWTWSFQFLLVRSDTQSICCAYNQFQLSVGYFEHGYLVLTLMDSRLWTHILGVQVSNLHALGGQDADNCERGQI
jgi:hypothetical protein